MNNLLNKSIFDTLMLISSVVPNKIINVDDGLRYIMFMEAVAREINATGFDAISFTRLGELAAFCSDDKPLNVADMAIYCELAARTHQFLK